LSFYLFCARATRAGKRSGFFLRNAHVNKFELTRSIKALVARALADEMTEGGDVRLWHYPKARRSITPSFVAAAALMQINPIQKFGRM
jgi:hypothetical protein